MPQQDETRSSIKNEDTYEALRDQGASKQKAARIANAQANDRQSPSHKGGTADRYEDRTKAELYKLAARLDIADRSSMTKADLIAALRAA